jgi:2-dehydro-3-deoxyphosphogluconate aldolase / (4S)-4-hydroxy-2-oxoglutarate aldolase
VSAAAEEVGVALRESRLLAILRGSVAAPSSPATQALLDAGVRCWEVSLTTPDALERVRELAANHAGTVLVGAGTVLTEAQADAAADAGARFLVAPNRQASVAAAARRRGLLYIPGVMTPSEAASAMEDDGGLVKLFPASQLGAAYLNALLKPLPGLATIAVGGIGVHNARSFLDAGAVAVGIGEAVLWGEGDAVAGRLAELKATCAAAAARGDSNM